MPKTLGGKFTAMGRRLSDSKVSLQDKNSVTSGDSVFRECAEFSNTIAALGSHDAGKNPLTIVTDDSLAESHVQESEDTLGSIIIEEYGHTPSRTRPSASMAC
jgi:hypothetical protein